MYIHTYILVYIYINLCKNLILALILLRLVMGHFALALYCILLDMYLKFKKKCRPIQNFELVSFEPVI